VKGSMGVGKSTFTIQLTEGIFVEHHDPTMEGVFNMEFFVRPLRGTEAKKPTILSRLLAISENLKTFW